MEDNKNKTKVDLMYDDLYEQGYLEKDRDTFNKFFYAPGEQGYKNRKALYDDLHEQGYLESPTYEDFAKGIGLHAVQQSQPVVQADTGPAAGGRQDLVESLNQYGEGLKAQSAPAAGNVAKDATPSSRGAGAESSWSDGKSAVRRPGNVAVPYTGIKKTDPVTGEQYRVYTGAAAANADTVPSELQGRDLLDENGNLISARQWQSKYGDKPHLAGAAGLWNGGDLEYGTVLDSHIQKAIDLGMKHGDHSRMSTDELKAKRQELTDRYANGFTETPESLQDAIDLNNIDYELTARHLGYKSSDDMLKNHRGEADFELNKGRLNQDDLDFYEKQGDDVHQLGTNPLYVYGWSRLAELVKRNEELGQSMSTEDYINALMEDPALESKFYAWALTRAKKNNRSWSSNIEEAMEDFRKAISRGENPWEYAPEEKDVMAKYATGELDKMDADVEKGLGAANERYEQWRKGGAFGLGDTDPYQQYMNATGDIDIELFSTAKHLNAQTRTLVDETMKGGGFMNSSIRGLVNGLFSKDTWDFGVGEMMDAGHMKVTIDKVLNNPNAKLTPGEQALMGAVAAKIVFGSFFGKYLPSGYKVGETTAQAIPFIIEMATGIGEATQGLVKAAAKYTARQLSKYGAKFLERIGLKNVMETTLKALSKRGGRVLEKLTTSKAGRAITRAAESKVGRGVGTAIEKAVELGKGAVKSAVGGVGYAAIPGSIKTAGGAINRTIGTPVVTKNAKTGKLEVTDRMGAEEPFMAFMKEFGTQVGEYGSEMYGPYLEGLTGGLKSWGKALGIKAADKMGIGKLVREIGAGINESDMMRIINDFKKMGHYDGTFNEYLEEVANNVYNAAFIGDMNWGTGENGVFNKEDNIDTYLSCLYMSGLFGIPAAVSYRTPKYRAKQDVKRYGDMARGIFGARGNDWSTIANLIQDNSEEARKQLIVDLMQSGKYSKSEKQAALQYAGAVYKSMGMDLGESKQKRSAGEQEAEEAYGRGYDMANLENIAETSSAYNQLRSQMEQEYGRELMKRMDDEPGLVYNWVRAGAVSEEDAKKVLDYLNAKMAYEGAVDRLNDDDAAAKAAAEAHIDDRVHTEDNGGDGQIHPVALKGREGDFFVVSGNVVASDEDGNVDVNASDNDIVVVDSEGKRIMTHAKDIAQVGDAIDPEAAKADAVAQIDGATQEVIDGEESGESGEVIDSGELGEQGTDGFEDTDLEETDTTTSTGTAQGPLPVSEYNQDDLVTVEVDGKQVTGIVTNGLDSDGNVTIYFDEPINGQQNWQMTPEQLNQVAVSYTSRDGETIDRSVREEESGESGENNGSDEVQDETPQQEEQPRYAVNPESLQGNEGDNFLNNTAAYLNGDMSAEDYLTSQGWDLDGYTPEQIKREADYQAQWAMPHLIEEQPAAPASEEVSGEPSDGEAIAQGTQSQVPTSGEYSVQSEEAASPSGATQQAPAQEQPQQAPAQPSLPVGEDGNADFSNATPQEAHDYIYNDPELDEDEANEVVRSYAAGAQTRLDEAQAALKQAEAVPAPKMEDYRSGNAPDVAGYKRAKRERNEAIAQAQAAVDAAQREVDLWKGVQAQHMMDRATAAAANRAEESGQSVENPAAPSAPAPVSGESENNAPTPTQTTPAQGQQTTEGTQQPSAPQPNEGNVPVASTTPSSEEERGESAPVNETAGAAEEELTPDERIERARMEALENRAEELAESCGLPVQVARSLDDLSDRHRREVEEQHAAGKYVNGFYDPMTKQIVLFLPDIAKNGGMRRLERTFLHEGVAHGGLRALFENAQNGIQTFDELCDQVWEMMPVVTQAQMMNYIGVQKPEDMTQEKKRIAADEYMAHLAEWGVEQSVKSRIISAVKNALRKIGVKMKLSNNDIVSLLAASRRKLNEMDKVGINSAISEALDNDGEDEGEGVRMSTTAIFEGAGLEVSRDATDNEGKPTKEPLTDSKGNLVARIGDKEFSVDNPVKAEDLKPAKMGHAVKESSVLHMLIEDSKKYSGLSDAQADKIYQNYADLLNMYLYMGSAAMGGPETVTEAWEWLGDSVFRTIAANGDAQYSYSMDIIRVCKKNEAVIKAMSALQLREGRGATPSEIVELYRETHEDGYQVPCPVCYVFTRYIRNGKYASAAIKGMEKWGDHLPGGSDVWSVDQWVDALDKIQRETNPDYKPDGKNKMKGKELEKAKRFKKQLDQANKITVAYEKRVNALSYLLTTDDAIKAGTIKNKVLELTPERRASIEKELDIINEQYQHAVEIIAHQALSNWIKTHAIEEKDGKWTMREDARKPEDIDDYKRNALDLRLTSNTIVNYPAIQRLRKSGGSAAGKEISFASDNRLGEVVSGLGINKTNLSGYKNKYEEALNATGRARTKARNEARKRFKDATVYALMQTLRGGQRMWSWSDNIERLSPDIAINIMQLQLLGGAMQTYSKQLEGIKLAAQMGAYVNGSLMAKDNGYQEVADKDVEERDGKLWLKHDITDEVEEYPVGGGEPKSRKRIVAAKGSYVYQAEDGKKYVLIYDDVVGVDPFGNELHGKGKKKGLFQLNQEYDRAGNILVGMNDLHVRAAMADPAVFFIIPWHSSGANNHILNQMLNILEQTMTDRLDYTAMQEEKNMLERNKNTKELPEVNKRLRDLWEEGRQWAKQNKWKSGMEVDSNGDVITESQYMYRQLRAQIFNGNIFEAMPSEEQYRAAVEVVNSMQATMDELDARNEAWKAKSPEYKKSPEGKAEKKAIDKAKGKAKNRYNPALHTIELHDGLIDWRDSSQHEGDAEWQEQHPKRINVEEARRMIEADEFLSQVLKRVEPIGHMTNGDNTYIYPYEYWDESSTYDTADINGKRYVEYCRRMGYKPKFSGRWGDKVTEENMNDGNFVHDPGYWKLLIDRRMYDRNGKYQWLDPVESENFEPDLVNPLKTGEEFNITQVADDKDAEDIAERVYNNMAERDGGVAKVDYGKPLEKIMDEYDAALSAGVQANVKLTDAEEDALDDMEEAMAEEGVDSGVMFSTSAIKAPEASDALAGYEKIHPKFKLKDGVKTLERFYKEGDIESLRIYRDSYMDSVKTWERDLKKDLKTGFYETSAVIRDDRALVEKYTKLKDYAEKLLADLVWGRDDYNSWGVAKNAEVSLDELDDLFARHNDDVTNSELWNRVLAVSRRLGVDNIKFKQLAKDEVGATMGGRIRYQADYYNDYGTPDHLKTETLLHEMIHHVTSYAIRHPENLTEDQKDAVERIKEVWMDIKFDPDFKGTYGITSPSEMVAELSDPDFRDKLKSKTYWEKLIDGVLRLLGIEREGANMTTAYDVVRRNLERLLSDPNLEAYNKHAETQRQFSPRFSVSPAEVSEEEREVLMGIHNITAEKLRSAIGLGGLANPSMAVVDTTKGLLNNFGEISLIPGRDLIDKKKGRNAGTFTADAYTPRFPTVHRRLGKGGEKKLSQWIKSLGMRPEMEYNTQEQFNDWVNGFDIQDNALVYPFLHEKGLSTAVDQEDHNKVSAPFREIVGRYHGDINALMDAFDTNEEVRQEITDIIIDDIVKQEAQREEGESWKEYRDRRRKWRQLVNEAYLDFAGFVDRGIAHATLEKECSRYVEASRFNPEATRQAASIYIDKNGMRSEYTQWREQRFAELGVEQQMYAGSDREGRSKYKPITLESVSKAMKKQGLAGGESSFFSQGPGGVRARLTPRLTSLNQIRAERGRIQSGIDEILEGYSEELGSTISNLFGGDREAAADVLTSADMKAKAKELGFEIGDATVQYLQDFKNRIIELPTEYFETKFERPVMLNEFEAAVVPNDVDSEIREALESEGLDVREYDPELAGDRERVTMEAAQDSGNVLFSTSPTFYSNAERAVENIKQNKATAEQWKAMLTKAGGIKSGEDKWMGLSTWLDENKGKSLTKDEVLQFVRDNGIQMEEVNYGDIYETSGYVKLNDEYMALRNDAERIFQEANKQFADYVGKMEAKYGDDYYRQMTPQERQIYNRLSIDQELRDPNIYSNEDIAFREMVDRYGDDFEMAFRATSAGLEIDDRDAASYFVQDVQAINFTRLDYTTEGLENKREIAFKVPNIEPYQEHDEVHFGPENQGKAVMWVRFGETTDADGNRVLVIDEIQSNRHQDAREKGYKVDEKTAFAEYKKAIVDYKEAAKRNDTEAMKDAEKRYNLYGAIAGQLPGGRESIPASVRDAVPAAPFEKNWHEVAMKRMLRLAAEEGFDKVAWTTGEQQAVRYALGGKVDTVGSTKWDNNGRKGIYVVFAGDDDTSNIVVDRDGNIVTGTNELEQFEGGKISDVLGKELSMQLMGEEAVELKGTNISIGGSGMKGFYDQMLPRFMDKYGKRWGVKTGTVELPNVEEAGRTMHSVDVTPEMKESVMQGQPLFSVSNYSLGVPYQGTKGRIARSLMEKLPSGRRFVDLFAGGGAMTHAAMLSGKYDEYLMNDVNPVGVELFMQGVRGEWDDYNRTSMTPEEFKQIKGTPEAIPWSVLGLGRNLVKGGRPDYVNRVKRLGQLKDQADKVSNSFEDYRNVEIRPGDVVYADIPYENTDTYNYGKGRKFDKKAFCDWAQAQDFPIFVSESVMPEGWVEIASESMKTINPKKNRVEKLWVQEKFANEYEANVRFSTSDGREESAIYINDGHTADGKVVDFANAILDGRKKGETRNHNRLTRKWVGIAKDGQVIGRVKLGAPKLITKESPEYKDTLIEGTEYDIADGESKYYYPVEAIEDMRDNPRPIIRNGNYGMYEAMPRNTEQEPEVDGGLRFSVREKPEPKKTIPVYKLMRLGDDGKLYPLFIDGTEPIELGVWYDADSPNMDMLVDLPIGVHLIDTDNGTSMTMEEYVKQNNIKLKKGQKYPPKEVIESTPNGQRWVYIEPTERGQRRFGGESRRYWNLGINGSGSVSTFSMRPGWHAGSLPTMRQIGKGAKKNLRDDRFVWVEGLISADIDYNEEAQGNPDNDIPTHIPTDGFYMKATNANAKASQADRVGWYISGAFMPVKIMSDSEARQVIDEWNQDHPDLQVEYDFPRESGKVFNAETMQLEDEANVRFSTGWHGSGSEFDRFDHSHMGEGEGAQAYGWGTYITSVEGIGRSYATESAKKNPTYYWKGQQIDRASINPLSMAYDVVEREGTIKKAISLVDRFLDNPDAHENWAEVKEILKQSKKSDFTIKPARYLYEVEIPDNNGENYISYDEYMPREQRDRLFESLYNKLLENYDYDPELNPEMERKALHHDLQLEFGPYKGYQIYKAISKYLGGDKAASEFLHENGFVGIEYPAQYMSGGRKDGSKNYVIFNAGDAKIVDRVRFSTTAAVDALKDDERVYNTMLGKVFSGVSNETRRGIVEDAMRNRGNDFGAATEAWLGGLADDGKFADVDRRDWGRVKLALHQALMDNGVDVSEPLTDGESRYVLWKAGQVDDGVFSMAEDVVMRDRLLNGANAPQYTDSADVRFSTSAYDVIKAAREAASGEPQGNGYISSTYYHGEIAEGSNAGEKYTIRISDHPAKWDNFVYSEDEDLDGRVLSIVITDDLEYINEWKGRGLDEITDRDGYDVEQYILNADDVDTDMLTAAIENFKKTGRSYGMKDGEMVGIQESGDGIQFSVTPRDRAIARDQYERWMKSGRMQWLESMQDSMLGLKKLMQAIMGNNWTKIEDVPMYENPYIAENLMSSVTAAQQQAFYTEFMKPLLEEVGKLCKGGKKAREKAREDLTNYLMAKHGLERNQVLADRDAQETAAAGGDYQDAYQENRERDYSGLTSLTGEDDVHAAEAKAQQIVDDYEAQHDTTELWNKINAATQVTLEKQYKSGMLSYAEYQRISDMFEYYVPLRGWEETTSDEVYGYLTSKAGPFLGGGIVKRAGGRTSKADDPIATIAQMGDDSIRTGNRNLMKQRFLNFVQNHPSDAVSVSDLWLQYDAVTDEWVPVFADIDPNDSPEVVEQKLQAFEQQMQQLASQEPTKYKHGREAANIPYRVIPGMEKEHQVLVKRNGQTWVLTINGNPRAAQALNGLTNPDVPMEGAWASMIKGAEWVNRTLSALYTTLSPAFIVSNFLRDTGYSNTMVWVRESPNYALRFNKNYLKLNPGTLRWLLGKWEEGTLDESKPLQKHFKEFMLNGGETGFAMVKDLDKYKKDLLNEVKNMNSRNFVRKGMKVLGSQYELLGRSIENCARFAAYMTSREMGRSAERAAYDAKEISVNFNKKGSGGKSLGKVGQTKTGNVGAFVSGMARSLYTFWNAGVQGMTNAGRAVKRHPVKAALMGVGPLYAAGFLAPILAQLMGAGGDGDDDKNAYYNLPEYVRRSNLCIWLGDAWLTIPLPIEFRSIYGLGELTYGVISGNERYSDEELAMQVAGQFSQLLPIDMLEGGGGFHPFIPTLFKPIVEAEQNKSWSGLPIYRSSEWNKDDPEYTKAFSNANEWIVSGAEWLNAMTGGDEFKKGWIDLNPAKIEYMLKGYLGGVYTTIDEVRRAAETAFGKRDFEWRNIPLANRVIKQGDERTESKKLRDEYFKYKDDYENTKHLINKYKNAENTDLFDYAKKLDLLNNSKEYGRYLIFEKYATMLEAYQKAKKGASGEVLKKIEEDEKALMRQLVDEMHAFEDGKITVGNRPKLSKKDRSEDYGYMYNKLRTYVDINEDALLDSALKRAKAADDKGLVAALNSIKRSISEMKKGLGRGKDEEVMNSIRQMRNSVLQSFGIIGGGEEEPPEVEEQWQEEPQEDWGDEGNADFDEPIEPYPDDEDDEYDY